MSPVVFGLLGVRIGDASRAGERQIAYPVVWELGECGGGEDHPVGVLGLCEAGEKPVLEHPFGEAVSVQLVVARFLRPFAVGREEQRLFEVDGYFLRVGADVPESDLVSVPHTPGQVHCRASIQRLNPNIVSVVQYQGLTVCSPTGQPIRTFGARVVRLLIDETHRGRSREVEVGPSFQILDPDLTVLPVGEDTDRQGIAPESASALPA